MTQTGKTENVEPSIRMYKEHLFKFNCYPGVQCFTQCCQDVTILLTPYDVLRMKRGLGISSDEFLDRYTVIVPKQDRLLPMVTLKMNDENKKCPFVSEKGCFVYEHRPWSCRMYPLDLHDDGTFHIVADPSRCKGLSAKEKWKIEDWLVDQGIPPYEEMNRLFSEITISLQSYELDIDNPQISKMIFMSLYNLDKFRRFVFESTFLDRFDLDTNRIERIRKSDEELLKLGMEWLKFGLFGEILFRVKEGAAKKS